MSVPSTSTLLERLKEGSSRPRGMLVLTIRDGYGLVELRRLRRFFHSRGAASGVTGCPSQPFRERLWVKHVG